MVLKNHLNKKGLYILLGAFTLSIFFSSQINLPGSYWAHNKWQRLPPPSIVKNASLGHDIALSGLLWIDFLLGYVTAEFEKKELPYMSKALFTITELNPRLEYAYIFGGLALAESQTTQEQSFQLFSRGIEEYPENYRLRLFAAMSQLSLDSNYMKATEILKPISQNSETPLFIKNFSATLLTKAGRKEDALLFLLSNYFETQSSLHKNILAKKMAILCQIPIKSSKFLELQKKLEGVERKTVSPNAFIDWSLSQSK